MLFIINKRFHKDTMAMRKGDAIREHMTFPDMRQAAQWMHAINRNTGLPYTVSKIERAGGSNA